MAHCAYVKHFYATFAIFFPARIQPNPGTAWHWVYPPASTTRELFAVILIFWFRLK